MKRTLLALCLIINSVLLTSCGTKITNPNIFKSGIYEGRTNAELSYYYTFYPGENSGTVDVKDGITGLPFRFDIIEVKGSKAKLIFHLGDESDNTEVTVTMKNENEYTINYPDRTDNLKFIDENLDNLGSYFKLHETE